MDETTVDENKILGNLSTTGRISVKVPSFELHSNEKKGKGKVAFRERPKLKRMKEKEKKMKRELELFREGFWEAHELYEEEKNKNKDNEELIKLLKEKINILENSRT